MQNTKRHAMAAACLLGGLLATVTPVHAGFLALQASVDGDGQADGMGDFTVRQTQYSFDVGRGPTVSERRSVIEFDLSGIAAGENVTDAQLTVKIGAIGAFNQSGTPETLDVELLGGVGNGILEDADFDRVADPLSSPVTLVVKDSSGISLNAPALTAENRLVFDVTSVISELKSNGDTFAYFRLQAATLPEDLLVSFYGSESGSLGPQLEVTTAAAVPEPASFLLFAVGVAGIGSISRRRRTRPVLHNTDVQLN